MDRVLLLCSACFQHDTNHSTFITDTAENTGLLLWENQYLSYLVLLFSLKLQSLVQPGPKHLFSNCVQTEGMKPT